MADFGSSLDGLRISEFEVLDETAIGGRSATFAPVPAELHPKVRAALEANYSTGLYAHQAEAVTAYLGGSNVCLSTSTASGKSLAFMTAAADLVLKTPLQKVLALYPARALIQDQTEKWKAFLEPLGISIGFIDGSVPSASRIEIMRSSQVLLMTPDVTHAWMMSRVHNDPVRIFLKVLRLLILDEAHVYDGVFGTNMAFFLRRLLAVSGIKQAIVSTATLGNAADFIERLTSLPFVDIGPDRDGSPAPEKAILLSNPGPKSFEKTAALIDRVSKATSSRFLAFGDSRRMVEQIVVAVHRENAPAPEEVEEVETEEEPLEDTQEHSVLPYRAGYESEDRTAIQSALGSGKLRGIVSTSALELGLDIGEIDLVLLLTRPPSAKSLWQRLGRAGRRRTSVGVILDPLGGPDAHLSDHLDRPIEPNWLYLDNRYIQYSHALCAATEIGDRDPDEVAPFSTLPEDFLSFLKNEINPSEEVPADLYNLKQRAQEGAQYEFPLRAGIEPQFKVASWSGRKLGELTWGQVLREAYPGAVYLYMARPFRATSINYMHQEIDVSPKKARGYTTRPVSQTKVFPRFNSGGVLDLLKSTRGFVTEVGMQVSERVLGFDEIRGSQRTRNDYGPGSPYSQKPLNRFFQTTGVAWFVQGGVGASERIAECILRAFATELGVHARDLGSGPYFANRSPIGEEQIQGVCVFDAAYGSLRLTQRLYENFADVIEAAVAQCEALDEPALPAELSSLHRAVIEMTPQSPALTGPGTEAGEDWLLIVAPGERAMQVTTLGTNEVEVVKFVFTPKGAMYELKHKNETMSWFSPFNSIIPIEGQTKTFLHNLMTGESKSAD